MEHTPRDDSLPHQITLTIHGPKIAVGCNCSTRRFGLVENDDKQAWELYDDESNHRRTEPAFMAGQRPPRCTISIR